VVLKIADINVPGRNSIVTAAIVIMDAESRCVCSATLAVDAAICVLVCASRWLTRWNSYESSEIKLQTRIAKRGSGTYKVDTNVSSVSIHNSPARIVIAL
jgi:ABC-type anion transport system duplicated permease subunit